MRGLAISTLLAGVCGCSAPPTAVPGDVILVTVDTLRPDHLGIFGYPRATSPGLERWFADGALFERAYTTSASTPPAVVSVLTGLLPQDHGVRHFYQLLPDATRLVSEHLADTHVTAGFIANAVLADEALGIASRFDHYDDFVDAVVPVPGTTPIVERDAASTTDAALRWLAGLTEPSKPVFLWVHYMDPHGPYDPHESWKGRFDHVGSVPADPDRIQPYQRHPDVSDALDYVDRYDEEIGFTDGEIARLLDGVARVRNLDTSLVLVTADHGEIMMERKEWFRHGYHVFEEILRVPMLARGPGIEPGRVEAPVSTVDIAPTILGFVGVDPPESMDGLDLRSRSIPAERTLFGEATMEGGQWRAAIRGNQKLMLWLAPGERTSKQRFRFALARDPAELRPITWPPDSVAAAALLERVAGDPDPGGQPTSDVRYREGVRLSGPKVAPDLDAAATERLRALGYVE